MLLRKLPIKGAEAGKCTHGGLSMRRFLMLAPIFLCFACMLLAEGKEKDKEDSAVQRKVAGLRAGTTKGSDTVRVIVQTNGDPDAQGVTSHIGAIGGKVLQKFNGVSGAVAEVPAQSLQALASHRGVSRVSLDENVKSHDTSGTSTSTLTAAQIQSYLAMFDNNRDTTGAPEVWFKYGVAGQDIGVAVSTAESRMLPTFRMSLKRWTSRRRPSRPGRTPMVTERTSRGSSLEVAYLRTT